MTLSSTVTDSTSPTVATPVSTVYGPVHSWRYGQSLGIDPIRDTSTCSFNCMYCQLGDIQDKTLERRDFVPTSTILEDLEASAWHNVDIITLSGSGEPTLALNCGDIIRAIQGLTSKPVLVLTNGTLLHLPQVQDELMAAEQVAVKLDAATEEALKQVNRPVAGVTLTGIVQGAKAFRERYSGKLSIQTMFMPANREELNGLAELIKQIKPDEVQLNTPKRHYPLEWHVDSRGNHDNKDITPMVKLKTIPPEEAKVIENELAQQTGVPILSIYNPGT